MRARKLRIIPIVMTIVILSVTSCVFVRLLKVKNQLNDFGGNFEISDKRGLTLIFLNPVLQSDDIEWLMKNEPNSTKQVADGTLWQYVLEKQYQDTKEENENYDIPVTMLIQNQKLVEISFPERFLENLSIPLLKKMFESMGNANVSKLRKKASSNFTGKDGYEIPTKINVLNTLGKPFESTVREQNDIYNYIYKLKKPTNSNNYEELVLRLIFTINRSNERLIDSTGRIRGLEFTINFSQE